MIYILLGVIILLLAIPYLAIFFHKRNIRRVQKLFNQDFSKFNPEKSAKDENGRIWPKEWVDQHNAALAKLEEIKRNQ